MFVSISASKAAANIANSQKSCGPCTHDGKEQSKKNSTTHGLSGNGEVLEPDERSAVDKRYDAICKARPPATALECHVAERISTHWIMVEKCEARVKVLYLRERSRACHDWAELRQGRVRALVTQLAEDPLGAIERLLQSPQGCEALIQQWDALEGLLEKNCTWSAVERQRAFDLLGVDPLARESGRTEFDPRPGDGTTFQSRAQQVIRREMANLRQRAASEIVQRWDEHDREDTFEERVILNSREARLAERYRAEQSRRVEWWWRALNRLQSDEGQEQAAEGARIVKRREHKKAIARAMKDEATRIQNERSEAALKEMQEAGILDADEGFPKWAQPTEQKLIEAEQRLAELQKLQAMAKAAEKAAWEKLAAERKAAQEARAARKANAKPAPSAEEPLADEERREHQQPHRQDERRHRQSYASASNGSCPFPASPS
jgi:hypothetical protein